MYTVPDNVVDKKLYMKIKNSIDRDLKKQNRRWSAYASGTLVKQYKAAGGRYTGKRKTNTGIRRWFREVWIDTCKLPEIVPCGRNNTRNLTYTQMKKTFPYCRPMHKVTKGTPKTAKELTPKQIKAMCAKKKQKSRKKSRK